MALETGNFVADLVETNPAGGDAKSQGDDHLRLLKAVLKGTFPGFVGAFGRVQPKSASYNVLATDNKTVLLAQSAITFALPDAVTVGNGFSVLVWAEGGNLTLDCAGTQTVNGVGIRVLQQGVFDILITNGAEWFLMSTDGLLDNVDLKTPTVQGIATIPDLLEIVSNAAPTKKFSFDVSGVALADTVTMTVPSKDFTPSGQGKQTIWIPASALVPRLTNGPAVGVKETDTNKLMIRTLDFDASTPEYAQFHVAMPKSWNKGTVSAQFEWSIDTSSGPAVWGVKARGISDGEILDGAWGGLVETPSTASVAKFKYRSVESTAVTPAFSGAAEKTDTLVIEISRETAAVGDTLGVDARLHGVMLFYSTDDINDA